MEPREDSEDLHRLLALCGVSNSVLSLRQGVTDTWRICRLWVRTGPRNKLTLRITLRFTEAVQFDSLFMINGLLGIS